MKKHWPKKKKKEEPSKLDDRLFEQDENFYFIAGFTPGGAPFGITWEEEEKLSDELESNVPEDDSFIKEDDLFGESRGASPIQAPRKGAADDRSEDPLPFRKGVRVSYLRRCGHGRGIGS